MKQTNGLRRNTFYAKKKKHSTHIQSLHNTKCTYKNKIVTIYIIKTLNNLHYHCHTRQK